MNAPASSFTAKQLRVTLTLATPNQVFPNQGSSNQLQISGLRMIAAVTAVARGPVNMELKIFGMLAADMNALTVMAFNSPAVTINTVSLEQNSGNGWTLVFLGTIYDASPDYTGLPNAFFRILANNTYANQITPVSPISFTAGVPVATIVQQLATQMNLTFENNGVTAVLNNSYYPGTAYDQLKGVCDDSDTDFYFDGKILAITPSALGRPNIQAVILNPQSGLAGYPSIEQFTTLRVQCLYNPRIVGGGQIQISGCDLPYANGLWNPRLLTHNLESANPNGAWMTTMACTPWGTLAPDIGQ